ncbi:NifU family protein [Myxococcota bacterium]|nr:NifU family protein [Myxococcota bacterium]
METNGNDTLQATPEEHRAAIQSILDQIRPALVNDGGDCELVDVSEDGKTVYLRLQGACAHCPSSIYTLKYGIEQVLRELVPGVETVEPVP